MIAYPGHNGLVSVYASRQAINCVPVQVPRARTENFDAEVFQIDAMRLTTLFHFETGPASPRVQMIGLGLVAILLGAGAVWTAAGSHELERNGARTVATVIALEGDDENAYPVFRFADRAGRQHTVRANFAFGDHAVGDTLNVLYPVDRPLRARIHSPLSLYFLPVLLAGSSAVFLAAAGIFYRFRPFFEKDFAARRGRLVTTAVGPGGAVTRSERSSAPLLKGVVLIFGIASAGFFGATAWAGWQSYALAHDGVATQGTVVRLVRVGASHRVWFEFTDSRGEKQAREATQSSNDHLVGDTIHIRYFPGMPDSARLDKPATYLGLPAYFLLLGALCLLIAVVTRSQQ